MPQLNYPSIQEYLNKEGYKAEVQKETDQLYALISINSKEYPTFFRIYEQTKFLQMLAFLPFEYKEQSLLDLGRLLHLFNKELDQPGFGLDEAGKVIFFRSMIPAHKGEVDEELFNAYMNATKNACELFTGAIYAVASGAATYDELHAKAEAEMKKREQKG